MSVKEMVAEAIALYPELSVGDCVAIGGTGEEGDCTRYIIDLNSRRTNFPIIVEIECGPCEEPEGAVRRALVTKFPFIL